MRRLFIPAVIAVAGSALILAPAAAQAAPAASAPVQLTAPLLHPAEDPVDPVPLSALSFVDLLSALLTGSSGE